MTQLTVNSPFIDESTVYWLDVYLFHDKSIKESMDSIPFIKDKLCVNLTITKPKFSYQLELGLLT